MQKRITLSIDSKVYETFQRFCKENDIVISKRVERLINKELQENGENEENGKNQEKEKNEKNRGRRKWKKQ